MIGVAFSPENERAPAAHSRDSRDALPIVISHDVWWRLFGADPRILGVHELAGRSVRVIGVMGPGVKFPGETNVWAPVLSTRNRVPAYVRLMPGATVEQLTTAFPELHFRPLREEVYPGEAQVLPLLFAAALVLLVVAWVQVAALMFSGSVGQLQEIGVRLALGAGRWCLVRQFAFEAALTVGAALVLAGLAVRPLTAVIVGMLPAELSYGQYLNPDVRTLVFGCTVSFLGFALLSLVPLGLARRVTPLGLLTGRLADGAIRVDRVRQAVLVCQMTLTAFLLYLSGLAVHSFVQAVTFEYGFDTEHVLVFRPPPWHRPDGVPRSDVQTRVNSVGVDFVRAIGATMIAGVSFDAPAYAGRDDVVVINETLARRLSPPLNLAGEYVSQPVIGHEIQVPDSKGPSVIIGVIKDLVDTSPSLPADPQLFRPTRTGASFGIAVRIDGSVDAALPALRATLERTWGPLPPRQFSLMRDELRTVLIPLRAQSVLLGLIATCCLPIAMIGLIGTLTHSVRVRTREIAVRLALGADPRRVRRAVVRRALTGVGFGILVGTGLGMATGSVIAHQLFQVRPVDLSTMVAVTIGLLAFGWLAALVPASSASRVEPAAALRQV